MTTSLGSRQLLLFLCWVSIHQSSCTNLTGASNRSCCREDQLMDDYLQTCTTIPSVIDDEDHRLVNLSDVTLDYKEKEWSEPTFKCPNGSKRLSSANLIFRNDSAVTLSRLLEPFLLSSNYKNASLKVEELNDQEYCLHPSRNGSTTAVLFCRRPVRVRKCCPQGQLVNRTSAGQCLGIANNSKASTRQSLDDWIIIQDDFPPLRCVSDYNIYLPGVYKDHRFTVLMTDNQTGRLYIPAAAYDAIRQSDEYCIDTTVYKNGKEDLVAMMCLPQSFYVMRWLLHNVYSIINFISAVLILVTFLVYLLLPPLRDNIQSWSMLCFFFCLFVMHVENGVFLTLRYEPHTWCLNKACVSGYFRLASSTWITVMGFNIWRQLRVKASRRSSRGQMYRSFLWRNIYAWGVPMIFELASHFYKQNNGCPTHVKRCWSCDSVTRNLAQMPNIILVTGNLIFFIPSAIRVYKSLSFLQTSIPEGPSLTKMERDRIHTIFRLFILMQFYTVPRILQWFVHAEWAKPELLLLCATIFLLIGPCVFYSFVCRRETLMLIKNHFSKVIRENRLLVLLLGCYRSRSFDVSTVETSAVDTNTVVETYSSIQYYSATNPTFEQ